MNDLSNEKDVDLNSLDIDKLKTKMLKGIYVLEAFLFDQAAFESKRIENTRGILSKLEENLFSEETLNKLDEKDRLRVYRLLSESLNNSVNYMQNLHENVATSLKALNDIKDLKEDAQKILTKKQEVPINTEKLEKIKLMILEKIKEKADAKD